MGLCIALNMMYKRRQEHSILWVYFIYDWMYNLVNMKRHLFFTFLPMFAEAVLRMHIHINSVVVSVTGWPECVIVWTGGRWVLLILVIIKAETVILPVSGNYSQLGYAGHRGGLIPWELRTPEEKTGFFRKKIASQKIIFAMQCSSSIICYTFTAKIQAE